MTAVPESFNTDIEKKVLENEAIIEFSLALNAAHSLDMIYQIIMRTCMGQKRITVTSLFLSETSQPKAFHIVALKGGDSKLIGRSIVLPDFIIKRLAQKEVITVQELWEQELTADTRAMATDMECVLLVPITFQQQLIGVLVCGPQIHTSGYSKADMEFLGQIASHAGVAIDHLLALKALQESYTQLEKRIFDLKAVEEINRSMSATLDLQEVCRALILTLIGHLTADSGALYCWNEDRPGRFERITQIGINIADLPQEIQVDLQFFDTIEKQLFIEYQPDLPEKITMLLQQLGARICIPVGWSKEAVGLCFFGAKATGQPYQTKELELASLLASQAVAPIRNSKFYQMILNSNRELQSAYEKLTTEMAERLTAEAKVAENALRLRTILDTTNEGFLEIDADGIITDVNPEVCTMLGRKREELIGHTLFDFVDPSETDILSTQLAGRKEGKKGAYELSFIGGAEKKIRCLIHASPIYDEKEGKRIFAGSFGMITDITQRKKDEEDLREYARIVSSSNDMMALIDNNNQFLKVNDAFLEGFGVDLDIIRRSCLEEIFDQEAFEEIHQRLHHCFAGENISIQCWVALPTGTHRFMDVALYPYLENGGSNTVSGAIIIMRDITRMKSLETQLIQAQKLEAIGTLAGGIAHDFNNILSGIFGYTQLAMSILPEGSAARKHLDKVLTAGNRAADLVRQILTFSRQTGQEKKPIIMAPIVKEVLKLIRASLPTTIELRQRIAAEQILCLADATQIHQVLMNLCTNAAHAIGEKSGVLEVELALVDIDAQSAQSLDPELIPGRYAQLSVKDTGQGMTPEIMDRIFEPFFTTKEPGKGTGMGLSVTHGIVKSHNGAITVASKPGEGSIFQVFFPVCEEKTIAVKKQEPAPAPTGNERILAVDDEEIIASVTKELISSLGYTVTMMTDSRAALETFSAAPHQYDLVITDETMPGMTGIELSKNLLRIRADIPIILTSGFSEDLKQNKIKESGIRGYMKKPWDIKHLAALIREVLDKK